ncbi:MAG: FecR domain-containing protein [Brevundimonas sp.]|uniref:FecR family protein n=1 Tax=Brevundimonas sp. TaxID=1871086 RepID=UPI00273618A9|nr:FecR domain-containing protein [Brevundimonas sp.]MDP3406310.1 FecR domain-containing protein [Brevundimonas sp.]
MTNPKVRVEAAEKEAAVWHARLGTTVVASQTIEDFFEWRSRPGNADAYRRVEQVWNQGRGLGADPEIAAALEGARKKGHRRLQQGRRSVIFGGLAAATAVALVIGGAFWWNERGVFETGVGEQRVVQLADGSSVSLDTGSRIHVRFANGERRIDLSQGQALFDVAHDATRPFVVHAGGTRITAVGTVFDVRHIGARVDVTLVSGVVDVVAADVAASPRRMEPGQKTQVTARGVTTREVNAVAETSWTTGRLIFTDVPLEEAVSEVNRYLTAKIEIDDPAIRAVAVNGVFRTGDRDAFVAASSDVMGLKAVPKADGSIGLSRRKINPGSAPG